MVQVRVIEERFRGNTSDVEASSTKGTALFDASNLGTMVKHGHKQWQFQIESNSPSCPLGLL